MSSRKMIVIATYNEMEALPTLVEQLNAAVPDAQILVIDDHSPDGTGKWCDQEVERNSSLRVIHRSGKLGLGTATILGLQQAIAEDYEVVATMDADLSHDPVTLAHMFHSFSEPANQCFGVLVGSRYVDGGEIQGWPWYRLLTSYLVNQYARIVLRLPTRDNTSAMRIYRVCMLRDVELNWLKAPGYAYLEEILVLLKQSGVPFYEHPIVFKNREIGSSKVGFKELASSLFEILKLSFRSFPTS